MARTNGMEQPFRRRSQPLGTTATRGYGRSHQQLRATLLPYAYGQPCPHCGQVMLPGQKLELDHTDDRLGYRGMSHAVCNRKAGARKGARKVNAMRRLRQTRRRSRW